MGLPRESGRPPSGSRRSGCNRHSPRRAPSSTSRVAVTPTIPTDQVADVAPLLGLTVHPTPDELELGVVEDAPLRRGRRRRSPTGSLCRSCCLPSLRAGSAPMLAARNGRGVRRVREPPRAPKQARIRAPCACESNASSKPGPRLSPRVAHPDRDAAPHRRGRDQIGKIEIKTSIDDFLNPDDSTKCHDAFLEQFGRDDIVMIVIEAEDLFSLPTLERLRALHEAIEDEVPWVREVQSLINLERPAARTTCSSSATSWRRGRRRRRRSPT